MRRGALALVGAVVSGLGAVAVASGDEAGKITTTQAIGLIRAVNLQPTDFPRSVEFLGEDGSPPSGVELQHVLHCGHRGKARGRALAAEGSVLADRYREGIGEAIGSLVIVMPSEALARAEITDLRSRRGRVCMAHNLRAGIPGPPVYGVKVTFAPVVNLLGPEAVDVHLLETLRRPPGRKSRHGLRPLRPRAKLIYSISAIFRVGVADIVFLTFSEHRRFPAATERHLLSLLYSRAKSHQL